MTTAIGNLIVAVIAAFDWPKQLIWNFVLYALLMLVFDFLFYILNSGFHYRKRDN